MIKKIICIICVIMCFGCSANKVEKVKKSNGDSKTYKFFQKLNTENYYMTFYDRNSSKNDDTKITIAKSKDKYYYEIDGSSKAIIIQKDGYKYNVDYDNQTYSKLKSEITDYSLGIIPQNIDKLKTEGYEKGKQKIYGTEYEYEKYKLVAGTSLYYYRGNKLIYIEYQNAQRTVMLKFDLFKNDFDENIFEIYDGFTEIAF